MPCRPSCATRLIQNSASSELPGAVHQFVAKPPPPQMPLAVPNRMSGFTGSRDLCLTGALAPQAKDEPTTLAAALMPVIASADFTKRRRSAPRPAMPLVLLSICIPPKYFGSAIIGWREPCSQAQASSLAKLGSSAYD